MIQRRLASQQSSRRTGAAQHRHGTLSCPFFPSPHASESGERDNKERKKGKRKEIANERIESDERETSGTNERQEGARGKGRRRKEKKERLNINFC